MLKLYENIKQRRIELGWTQSELASKTGYSDKSMISRIEAGKVDLPQSKIMEFAKVLGVSASDLMGWGTDYISSSEVIPNRINFYERVAAGDSKNNVMDTYMELIRILPRNPEEYFAVRVSGDSMLPTISDGDTVLVRRQNDVENGEIAVVNINGDDATIKRVYKSEQGITLVADNPSVYPPHFYSNEEIGSLPVIIQGKAEKRIGDLK